MRLKSTRFRATLLPVLLAALWFGACSEQGAPSDQLLGPDQAQLATGGGGWKARYTLLGSQGSFGTQSTASAQIGAAGGDVSAAGFKLLVPPGAVNRSTTFTITALADGSHGVALTATRTEWNGRVLDVGRQGFRKDVLLVSSYAPFASQLSDPSKLEVLWVKPDKSIVAQRTTVDTGNKVVTGWLQHFSDYALGYPNIFE